MLGTVVLALGHDPSWDVSNTHRRFGTVNVLTARAGRAINVDAQIRRIDFDIDIVINFRVNKRGAERRVATTAGVKRVYAPCGERQFLYAASRKRNRRRF